MVRFVFVVQESVNLIHHRLGRYTWVYSFVVQSDLTGAYRLAWCTMEFTGGGRPASASSILAIVPFGYLGGEETLELGDINHAKISDLLGFLLWSTTHHVSGRDRLLYTRGE